ncbi:LOG family protein [Patescibacteria group bacterium]|nr:LOG family protein [Patescibacteria group bacterium]MBU1885734.1 LOG family protein [Patescibacteria group bacterium]
MRTQINIPPQQVHSSIRCVAIFGSADVDEKHPLYQEAFNVARYLAYHDKVVVDGGGPGVMAAATAGAEAAGGETIAITFYPKDMPEFEGRDGENNADKEIKTANYIERMFGLINYADAFVIFQGGTGTLSEWSTAWLLAHLYYGNHKPLILYGEFWHEVMHIIDKYFFIGEKEKKVYKIVKNEEEMIQALNEFEQELEERCGLPRLEKLEKKETGEAQDA